MMLLQHNIPVMPPIIYWAGAAICLFYFFSANRNQRNKAYVGWIVTYIVFFMLSTVWSIKPKTSLFVFVIHLLPIFSLTFATMVYLNSYDRLKKILYAYYLCSTALLIYLAFNVEDFLLGVRLGSSLNDPDDDDKLWNANVIGMTLSFAIYAGWLAFMDSKRLIKKSFYVVVSIIMLLGILLTGSRKTLLMLFIPVSFYMYKRSKQYFFIAILGFIAFMMISYYMVMNVEVFYNTLGIRVEEAIAILEGKATGQEDDSRYYLIQYGLEWWQENPIIGIGINCYRVLSNATSMFAGKNFYAHNNYIELLVDVGIVGTFLYYTGHFSLISQSLKLKTIVGSWIVLFVFMLLVLDVAYVSYYDINNQLMMVILFCVLKIEKNKVLQNKYENSRYYKVWQY